MSTRTLGVARCPKPGRRFGWCPKLTDAEIWQAATEHHFTLIAARNLLRALELPPRMPLPIDKDFRAEVIEIRDLHEHWDVNAPVFNVTPRFAQPTHRSGKDFAARYPDRGPYWWLGWGNKTGATLSPGVSAPVLHALLDQIEAQVLSEDPKLSSFVPAREPSPWVYTAGEWWPKVNSRPSA